MRTEAACPSPVACYCGGMVDGVVLPLKCWSNVPVISDPVRRGSSSDSLTQGLASDVLVTPDPERRGSSSDSLTQGMADDVPVTVCRQHKGPRLSWCRGRAIVGGSAGVNPEVAETLK